MRTLLFSVPPEYDGSRLDTFLRERCQISGTVLKRAKRISDGLLMDGKPLRTVDSVRAGAEVSVAVSEEERIYAPCALQVPVLFEDASFIVFNKPAGVPSHPSRGHPFDTMANVFASRAETRGLIYRPVNRLDKDTSGILLAAKHPQAAYALMKGTRKLYLALACGEDLPDGGTVDRPIARPQPGEQKRAVMDGGKPARTHFRVLLRGAEHVLVCLTLDTGRTHQIRVHLADLGHPLSGDALYGGDGLIARQALHCAGLWLTHPLTGELVEVWAPPPADFCAAVRKAVGAEAEPFLRKAFWPFG